MTLDEQIILQAMRVGEAAAYGDASFGNEESILASLKELKAIRSVAGRPVEPDGFAYLRKCLADDRQLATSHFERDGITYINALSRYADAQADLARRNQEDAERYRWIRSAPLNGSKRDWLYMPHTEELDATIDAERKS